MRTNACFLVLALVVGVATAGNLRNHHREPAQVGKTVEAALGTIEKALAMNKQRQGVVAELCAKEQAETQKWIEEGGGIDNKDRVGAKEDLKKALVGRIGNLKKFLGKLKNIRKRLRSHIIRVNSAFGTKYQENDNAMQAAKSAMDPQAGLKLLKLPAEDTETQADRDEMAADDGTAVSFLEVGGSKIAELSQKLYEVALENSRLTRANIEKERATLGAFRDKIRALILKREAKLSKLSTQLDGINKALEAGGSFMGDIWPLLEKHLKTTVNSCRQMEATFKEAEATEGVVIKKIKEGPAVTSTEAASPLQATEVDLGNPIQF